MRSSPVDARLGTIPMSGNATGPGPRLADSYPFVCCASSDLLSRSRSVAETERRGQRAQVPLRDAAHGDEHAVGAKCFAQRRDGRCDAAEALGQQRDHGQQRSAHWPQTAPDRTLGADQPDRTLSVGGMHLLGGGGDAAGLLDGVHGRFDRIQRAGHPRCEKRRQKADRPARQRTPEPGYADPFWLDTPVRPELAKTTSTLRVKRTLAENCPLPRAIGYIPIGGDSLRQEYLHVAIEPARGLDAWAHPFRARMLRQVRLSR